MHRQTVPLHADDISGFARALARQLRRAHEREPRPPGHQELLNMLARAAGFRNFQSLSARPAPKSAPQPTALQPLSEAAQKALRQHDDQGRIVRWPVKHSVQRILLWGLWMRFENRRRYTEREVNEILNAWHLFGDHCILRRELVEMQLLVRTSDGAEYRKVPARPDADTQAMLRALRARAAH